MRFAIAAGILLTQLLPTATEEGLDPQNTVDDILTEKDKKKRKNEWQVRNSASSSNIFNIISGEAYGFESDFGSHRRRRRQVRMNRNGRLMNNKMFPPTTMTENFDGSTTSTTTTNKNRPATMHQPCDPTNNNNNKNNMMASDGSQQKADVGILECGDHRYCMESIDSSLGGFCVSTEAEDRMLQQTYTCEGLADFPFGYTCIYYQRCFSICDDVCYNENVTYYRDNSGSRYNSICLDFYKPVTTSICVKTYDNNPKCVLTYAGQDCASCYDDASYYGPDCFFFDCSNVQGPYQQGIVGGTCKDTFYTSNDDECTTIEPFFFEECGTICPTYYTRDPCMTACPYGVSVSNPNATTGLGIYFLGREDISCGEAQELAPLLAFYNGYVGEEGCTNFQNLITSQCGCQLPSSQPTESPAPSDVPSSQPSNSLQPSAGPTSSPTMDTCPEFGSDVTCRFNEDDNDKRRIAVCLQKIDEETGFVRFRNECIKSEDLEGIFPGEPINAAAAAADDDGSSQQWTLSDCGCCDKCDVLKTTGLDIPRLENAHVKYCRRPAICTPDDDDDGWEVCDAWGNGIVKTIKVCITHHEDGTREETCVDPFFIPSHASDIVTCGGCATSLN